MKLIEHFPSWMTDGLFDRIGPWCPWLEDQTTDTKALDVDYFSRFGQRESSNLLDLMTATADGSLSANSMQRINLILKNRFENKWQRVWNILIKEQYDAMINYDMTEEENTGTDIHNVTKIKTDVKTEQNVDSSVKSSQKVKPFSSTDVNPVTISESDTDTDGAHTGNYSHTTGALNDNVNDTQVTGDFDDNHRKLTRKGNIGVMTAQDLITQEIELRNKYEFFEMVFADVNTVLTIPYYESAR